MIRKLSLGVAGLSLVALGCQPAPPPNPTSFDVNTTKDTTDVKVGDGLCVDSSGKCSLRAAVQEANASSNQIDVNLERRTYSLTMAAPPGKRGGDLDVKKTIRLHGNSATIRPSGLGDRAFDVNSGASLTVDNLRIRDAAPAAGTSGGAFRNQGALRLDHVTVTGSDVTGAGASGGAVFNDNGILVVTNSDLSGNSAARAGGAVEANAGTTIIDQTTMNNNTAGAMPGNGGALHLTGAGDVTVNRSIVSDNTAASEGGGLWNSGVGTMTVTDAILTGNVANGEAADNGGGALFNDGGNLTVNTSTVSENSADQGSGSGGGVLNNAGTLTVRNSTLAQNSAARAGGAVETAGGSVVLFGARLENNDTGASPGNGGGLHAGGAATVSIDRSTVTANAAALEGGGLWNSALGTMTINRSTIAFNTADGQAADNGGGGVFNQANAAGDGGGTLLVTNSVIAGNVADSGSGSGGGILSEHGATTVTNSTVSDNIAARAGGGVEVAGGTTDLADVELNRNSTGNAPGNGGGLHLGGASVVTIDASQVLANHASNEGGGLWNSPAGTLTVTNTSVTSNTVGIPGNGPNVFQKGPVAGGTFFVDVTLIPEGPNTLAFG